MSTTIPVLTQRNLKERGVAVYTVICPKCHQKYEALINDRPGASRCITCDCPTVPWTTWDKERVMAEIDLMPTRIFIHYLTVLVGEQMDKGNLFTVAFLDARISMLKNAIDCYVLIDSADFFVRKDNDESPAN